jgi:DNA-binding MarR family transcriptional regulator
MGSKPNRALDESPTHLFHRVGQRINEIFHAERNSSDLTARQISVLATVAQHEGLSQTGLVNLTDIDRSTMADIVRRLQRKGFVQRRRTKDDARAYSVRLTEEGWHVARTAEPLLSCVDKRILNSLARKDRARLVSNLKAIVAALKT